MAYIKKVVPTTRISDVGVIRLIEEGTPIGLLIALTYPDKVEYKGVTYPPISRLEKKTKP